MDKPTITRIFLDTNNHPHTFQYTTADFYVDDSNIITYYDAKHKPVAVYDHDANSLTLMDSDGKPGAYISGKPNSLHNFNIDTNSD